MQRAHLAWPRWALTQPAPLATLGERARRYFGEMLNDMISCDRELIQVAPGRFIHQLKHNPLEDRAQSSRPRLLDQRSLSDRAERARIE